MIRNILFHNQHRRLPEYIPEPAMVADGVEPYPLQLWQWGIAKRSGLLRIMDPQYVRLGLLPRRTAVVTDRGIRFQGLYYDCETARREDWYARARQRRWSVTIAYDPRAAGIIYYCPEKGKPPERCTLLSVNEWFNGLSWWEVEDYLEREKQRAAQALEKEQAAKAEFNAHADAIIDNAGRLDADKTKTERLSGIRDNRAREKAHERSQDRPQEMSPTPDPSDTPSGYIPAPQNIAFLRRLRDQRNQTDDTEDKSS